ncbi:uncharacterized protein FA14DRAFT_121482 [Meira miltonrushii]|uniref:Glycosyl transferase CAP10 domain-containing protein n=1 Tax=Meira miltonrushii TaxID=1280837 RepID=A0A316VAY5_9BASI|nr:uncharacterized protein FA14DRAFT_121482 [Meira miltonrushii]PWN34666.1 hypothetical protein FA14DRAFT_121482 [Meira miltonrushii]
MIAKLIETNTKAEVNGGYHDWAKTVEQCRGQGAIAKRALILRAYENYIWGLDDIRNVRALIVELTMNPEPKDRYDVHLLLEVHTRNSSYAMSEKERTAILQRSIPREFWSLTTLWSEEELTWLYPNLPGQFLNHMIPTNSYRSCFMPVQVFSKNHPQYDFIWNWEMDTRSTQEYSETLERIGSYAKRAPIDQLLEHQSRWNIPASSTNANRFDINGEEADLITLNPFFNTNNSGYYWAYDFQKFPKDTLQRSSIGKNVRFSKRLLKAMSDANAEERMSAHCENYAATMLVHKARSEMQEKWKGVYVPHPIYTRRVWPEDKLSKAVNRDDVYRKVNERVLREFSFYYDGAHAKDIYVAWRNNSNACRAPSLLHPIKRQP